MKQLLIQLKRAQTIKQKRNVLLNAVYENPLAWRIVASHFDGSIYTNESEIISFFRFAGIKEEYKGNMVEFIKDCLDDFKMLNKGRLRPSLLSIERKFIDLQYKFRRMVAPSVRYESYFDVFMNTEPEDIEWIVHILLRQWETETGATTQIINKIQEELNKMEYEKDIVISVSMMNKHTNQIMAMDMIVTRDILNTVMKDKVHKAFDKILKDTVDKLSTVNNINKLLYSN